MSRDKPNTNAWSSAHSFTGDHLAVNVLRSPAYSSFNISPDDERLNGRFLPRQDQGEHEMSYRIRVGKTFRESDVVRDATALNRPPVWQVYYSQPEKVDRGRRTRFAETIAVDDREVHVVAVKKAEKGQALIVRLQNTSRRERQVTVRVKPQRGSIKIVIGKYGLTTLKIHKGETRLRWREVNLMER